MHRSESEQVDATEKGPGDIESQITAGEGPPSAELVEQPEPNERA
jgi:hypothetical protein